MRTIVILGMHRSGTSCLTGCLQQMGLKLGDVSEFNEYNLKGNKEDDNIAKLNENILNHNGGSWRNPPPQVNWTLKHEIIRDEILKDYEKLPSPIGFKDPRMLFTLPFWQEKLVDLNFLGSFRHPLNVAKSLYARKNIRIEIEDGLKLWSDYNLQLLTLQKKYGFDLVNFDLEPDDYLNQLILKANKLNLKNSSEQNSFFDKSLRNQQASQLDLSICSDEIIQIYNSLLEISMETSTSKQNLFKSIKN